MCPVYTRGCARYNSEKGGGGIVQEARAVDQGAGRCGSVLEEEPHNN